MLVVVPLQGSPLDSFVTLPQKDRTLDEVLGELVRNLTRIGPVPVHEPGMPVRLAQRFTFSANNEPARNVLASALQTATATGARHPIYVWDLLYAPNFGYVLNVYSVKRIVKVPDGDSKLVQVESPNR